MPKEAPLFEILPILSPPFRIISTRCSGGFMLRLSHANPQHNFILIHEIVFNLNPFSFIHIDALYKAAQGMAVDLLKLHTVLERFQPSGRKDSLFKHIPDKSFLLFLCLPQFYGFLFKTGMKTLKFLLRDNALPQVIIKPCTEAVISVLLRLKTPQLPVVC